MHAFTQKGEFHTRLAFWFCIGSDSRLPKMLRYGMRGSKRKVPNRDETVKEEQEKDTNENEDKRQDERHDYLEFPKKLTPEFRQLVHHFTGTHLLTLNKFLPKQTLNECVAPACFHKIGMTGNSAPEKLKRAMLWTDCSNMITARMSHRRSTVIEKIKNLFQGETNPHKQTLEQHELIFNLYFFQ